MRQPTNAHTQADLQVSPNDLTGLLVKVKTSLNNWESVKVGNLMDKIEKVIAERHLAAQRSTGVWPAHQETSISNAKKKTAVVGKPQDILVDELVVEVEEPKVGDGKWMVMYCIGCLKRTSGHDANWIKQHGKNCNICFKILR